MKAFLMSVLMVLCFACSHHHDNKTDHHHHQFDKKCAYEVSQNHLDIKGNPEITLEHNGEIYYFSSEENKSKFKAELDQNIKISKENWIKNPPPARK